MKKFLDTLFDIVFAFVVAPMLALFLFIGGMLFFGVGYEMEVAIGSVLLYFLISFLIRKFKNDRSNKNLH